MIVNDINVAASILLLSLMKGCLDNDMIMLFEFSEECVFQHEAPNDLASIDVL